MSRYEDMLLSDNDLRKICIIKGDTKAACSECGIETEFIDYCTERHICSEECMKKQDDWLNYMLKDK